MASEFESFSDREMETLRDFVRFAARAFRGIGYVDHISRLATVIVKENRSGIGTGEALSLVCQVSAGAGGFMVRSSSNDGFKWIDSGNLKRAILAKAESERARLGKVQ
jgi:hypothetical protein